MGHIIKCCQTISCYLTLFSLCLIAAGCYNKQGNAEYPIAEALSKDMLKHADVLHIDTIYKAFIEDTVIYGEKFLVYNDTILIVENGENKHGHLLEFYNLRTKEIIAKYYPMGHGHDEALGLDIRLNEKYLLVNEWVTGKVALMNVDSILLDPEYAVTLESHNQTEAVVYPYGGDYLYGNPCCFTSKEYGINQSPPEFPQIIRTNGKETYIEQHKLKYYTGDVAGQGNIVIDAETKNVAYLNPHKSEIGIYDKDLDFIKKITGPVELETRYETVEFDDMGRRIIFKGRQPYGYLNFCSDGSNFYVTYVGGYLYNKQNIQDLKCYIMVYNRNWEFVKCYSTGTYVCSITKSEKEDDAFYATVLDNNGSCILVKLTSKSHDK